MKTIENRSRLRVAAGCVLVLVAAACLEAGEIGTAADREALFASIMDKTLRREAFSEIKNERLGLDVEQAMRHYQDEVVNARNEVELFYALVKLSNARRDQHLAVEEIEGGLSVEGAFDALARQMGHDSHDGLRVPVKFAVGFADPLHPTIFVSQIAAGIDRFTGENRVRITDRVLAINGVAIAEYAERARPYIRFSTEPSFWVRVARVAPLLSPILPPDFYREVLELELENDQGSAFTVRLPYLGEDSLQWRRPGWRLDPRLEPRADFNFDSFNLFVPRGDEKVLLLQWVEFDDDLVEAIDRLMETAVREDWLDYDLIVDCTQSRGGSLGPYALQRLCPKAFRTTFGNVRMSDVIPEFILQEVEELLEEPVDPDRPVDIDDGTWRVDWLTGDVLQGYRAGEMYSSNVPFKLAHAPSDSDGILQPAETHFRGKMVCWLGPGGGSHLDQFSAIINDNDLAYTIGMPTAGYSNTWEWKEDLAFPGSKQPVARFMWTIGHAIRPNGEVLEGNPADVDEWRPITRENYPSYYETLVEHSLARLRMMRGE